MATIRKSGDVLYLRQTSRSSRGISTRHGGHQVAQKLTSTTLPFRSSIFDCLPSSVVKEKEGMGWPVCVYDCISSPAPAGVCVAAAFGQMQSSSNKKQIASFMFVFLFSLNIMFVSPFSLRRASFNPCPLAHEMARAMAKAAAAASPPMRAVWSALRRGRAPVKCPFT